MLDFRKTSHHQRFHEKRFSGGLSLPIKPLTAVCLVCGQALVFQLRGTDPSGHSCLLRHRQPFIENVIKIPELLVCLCASHIISHYKSWDAVPKRIKRGPVRLLLESVQGSFASYFAISKLLLNKRIYQRGTTSGRINRSTASGWKKIFLSTLLLKKKVCLCNIQSGRCIEFNMTLYIKSLLYHNKLSYSVTIWIQNA